ncbi:MAG: S8 family serine peptidase [Ardenticatenaceae bacterium]
MSRKKLVTLGPMMWALLLCVLFIGTLNSLAAGFQVEPETPRIPTYFVPSQVTIIGDSKEVNIVTSQVDGISLRETIELGSPNQNSITVIGLYQISDTGTVTDTVQAINDKAVELSTMVVAEPNFFLAGAGLHISGSPGAPPVLDVAATNFSSQWTWEPEPGMQMITPSYTGQGIPVAVFDTSTFTEAQSYSPYPKTLANKSLQVWHLSDLTSPTSDALVPGHGYSVASLIDHIAPDADLHLFRVLNEHGIGDLFTLNKAIHRFISSRSGPGVINLSLGVLADTDTITDIVTLKSVLLAAQERQFLTVAAAGNWSTIDASGNPLIGPTQYPAAFPFVLSVAANNANGDRSCFSSPTNGVSAPGGNGAGTDCQPPTTCPPGQCVTALDPTSTGTGASGWIGSSFATSLVSGIAAVAWEKGQANVTGGVTPEEVICAIELAAQNAGDAHLGHGIANLPNTLNNIIPVANNNCLKLYFPLIAAP